MDLSWLWLIAGGAAAGIVNAVAGGGALLIYPLLLGMGVNPLSANATVAVAAWPGALSSAYGYRSHLRRLPRRFLWLLAPCFIGGALGAVALEATPVEVLTGLVPWFILAASLLLLAQPWIHTLLHSRRYLKLKQHHKRLLMAVVMIALLAVSVYGGYFGAGFGIIMLALLGLTEIRDMQMLNGLKNLASFVIHVVGSVLFVVYGLINWQLLPWLIIGSVLGGWLGAHYGAKLPARAIHAAIIVIGLSVSAVLFIRQ